MCVYGLYKYMYIIYTHVRVYQYIYICHISKNGRRIPLSECSFLPPFLWPTPNWPQPMSPRNNQEPQFVILQGLMRCLQIQAWLSGGPSCLTLSLGGTAKLKKRLFTIFLQLETGGHVALCKGRALRFQI